MELKKKLEIALDIIRELDEIPASGDSIGSIEDFYKVYAEKLIGHHLDGDVSFEEFKETVLDYSGYDKFQLDQIIREQYFNN